MKDLLSLPNNIYYDRKFITNIYPTMNTKKGMTAKINFNNNPFIKIDDKITKNKKILIIENDDDMISFSKKYVDNNNNLLYNKLKKDYNGLDIYTFSSKKDRENYIHDYGWVDEYYYSDGGIIWDHDNIHDFSLI